VNAVYTFHIRADAKFNDGSKIKASDVGKSIKRILVKKKSTHFPLWNHVLGCENLEQIDQACEGISWNDDQNIVTVKLKGKSDSFLLQISSPESAIWAAQDIDADCNLVPTKYSGPYRLESLKADENKEFMLLRNSESIVQQGFPQSPKKIIVKSMERSEIEKAIVGGSADVFIGDFIPYNEHDWEQINVGVHHTTPSSIIYFFGLNSEQKIGLDLLEALALVPEKRLLKAGSFLPFAPEVSLGPSDFAEVLPKNSSKKLKIAAPGFYFKDQTLEFIKSAAHKIGIEVEIFKIERSEYFELVTSKDGQKSKYDFLLGSYVASERYPAVQLRFLTGARTSPVNLSDIEQPDQDPTKIRRLKDYQKWLLKSQTVVPVYFMRSHIVSSSQIDVGDQPTTDADIQLWRLTKKEDQ
jgi:ABC-type transport system substrate-binding protein